MTMKINDQDILELQKLVQAKQDKIVKLEGRFSPETTCTYKRYDNDQSQNLHTKKQEELVKVLANLISDSKDFEEANKLANTSFKFKHQNFTFDQWKNDILFLIEKTNLKQLKEEFSEDNLLLDSLISKEAKDKLLYDKIYQKYKL